MRVTEAAQFPDHLGRAALRALSGDRGATFLVGDTLVEDLPD